MWRRKGWAAMDTLRERLEDLKELRDLVRSLGRGGGWGPLRRAPVQVRTEVHYVNPEASPFWISERKHRSERKHLST